MIVLKVKFKVGSSVFVGYQVGFYMKKDVIWYIVDVNGRLVHTKGAMEYE